MKSKIFFIAIVILGLTACGGGHANEQDCNHSHEDGCTEHNHAAETAAPAAQESFKVEADTLQTEETHDHDCDHDHAHDHAHEDGSHHTH